MRPPLSLAVAKRKPKPVSGPPLRAQATSRFHLDQMYQNVKTGGKLFISNLVSAQNESLLERHEIRAVVNACHTKGNTACSDEYQEFAGIEYLHLDMLDAAYVEPKPFICESLPFIHKFLEKGQNVLVHCYAGISRSATIIASYILLYNPESITDQSSNRATELLTFMATIRPQIEPNLGFHLFLEGLNESWENWAAKNCHFR